MTSVCAAHGGLKAQEWVVDAMFCLFGVCQEVPAFAHRMHTNSCVKTAIREILMLSARLHVDGKLSIFLFVILFYPTKLFCFF